MCVLGFFQANGQAFQKTESEHPYIIIISQTQSTQRDRATVEE